MSKRFFSFILLFVMCSFITAERTTQTAGIDVSNQDNKTEQSVFTLQFYHSNDKYNQEMVDAYQIKNKSINIQIAPIDLQDYEKEIKIGIAAGNPPDVAFSRGNMISAFSNLKMAEDLTPYLDSDKAWKNSFNKEYLSNCSVNEKYYAVPYQPEIEVIYYNKDLFKKLKIEVPETWDSFIKVCSYLKNKGIYGIGVGSDEQYQLLKPAYQIMAQSGKLDEITGGKVPLAGYEEAPGLRQAMELIRGIYKNEYWYPGVKAPVVLPDEVKYAFYHGKIGMMIDSGSEIKDYAGKSDFELGIMNFPRIDLNSKYTVNLATDALFVPHSARHKKEAVDFIKFYTSTEGQNIIMKAWRLPANKNIKSDIQLVNELENIINTDNSVMYKELQLISPEIKNYITNEMIPDLCTGTSIDDILDKLEKLRQAKR